MCRNQLTCLREDDDQHAQADGGNNLDTQGELPLGVVAGREAHVSAVGDPRSAQGSNTEHELLQRGDSTTDLRVTDLSLVQGNDHSQEADTVRIVSEYSFSGCQCQWKEECTQIQQRIDRCRDRAESGHPFAKHHPDKTAKRPRRWSCDDPGNHHWDQRRQHRRKHRW